MPRFSNGRSFFARIARFLKGSACPKVPLNTHEFQRACKELAFWSASDAGLSGAIEGFDGVLLHPAADGMFTLRMTLKDSLQRRSPSDAATIILRSLEGLRILLLIDIDGRRFASTAPNVNPGIRELCEQFTNRTESTG